MHENISIEYLKECMDLVDTNGTLVWRRRPDHHFKSASYADRWNKKFAGKPALCTVHSRGYLVGMIGGKNIFAHRAVFALSRNRWPTIVDHINRDKRNNSLENLREATHLENRLNRSLDKRNVSGCTGVRWCDRRKKWHAQISRGGQRIHLCLTANLKEAIDARKAAEIQFS